MLQQWYNSNPSKELNGKIYSVMDDEDLNHYQKLEMSNDTFSLREPIEAYSEQWTTAYDKKGKFVSAAPVAGTRRRNDLPPLYIQWKDDYKRRFCGQTK
jgi:hypothetical protein